MLNNLKIYGNIKNAIYSVYGKDYAGAMIPVSYSVENIEVSGMIGKGTLCRPNRNFQSFYVNKRYIKSGLLIKAAEEAYKNQIMIGKFPVLALNVKINPASIDINVHPTKLEVKFSDEKSVYEAVYYAVKSALYALPNVPEIKKEEPEESNFKREGGIQVELKKEEKKEPVIEVKKEEIKISEPKPEPRIEKETVDPLAKFRKAQPEKQGFKVAQPEESFSVEKKAVEKPEESPLEVKKEEVTV